MKIISAKERLEKARPFTKVEIYFRINNQVESYEEYTVYTATQRIKKCVTRAKLMIGDTGFSAEITCRALQYGDTWKHVQQVIINQKIA